MNLATKKQFVLYFMVELQKAKNAAWMAREATKAAVKASYERRVRDTETWLAEEVVKVCKDYCTESWQVAMDRAGVPADSELMRAKSIFVPEDIREIPESESPPEQLLTSQAPLLDAKVSKGAEVGKRAQSSMKAKPSKDALTIRDVVSQAKDAEARSKASDVHSKAIDLKKDPPQAKA